ncbi:mannosyltransferase [Dentipellis sp. KUC8613]|nr:mannosyltransferase [Dentipellis sp. KUC8613]
MEDILHGPVPQIIATLAFVYLIWRLLKPSKIPPSLRSVAILVLGDIGRSPRMMYHAESFAKIGFETFLIGYKGSQPAQSLLTLPHVHFIYLAEPPAFLRRLPFILVAPFKILQQILTILGALMWWMPHPPEFILVQNPPSIPTLALVFVVGRIRGSKVIIDWHNLGYSILALKLGPNHLFVRLAKKFEATFGKYAYAHLFVTRAMKNHLVKEWDLQGLKAVLHDRPPAHFHRASPSETHELFLRLSTHLPIDFLPKYNAPYSTCVTQITATSGGLDMPSLRADRPAIVVSSTSWTEDEDFSILLDALEKYEERAREVNHKSDRNDRKDQLPKLLMIVTGKGPLKTKYMREVQGRQNGKGAGKKPWEWVHCVSLWLQAEDYPLLLGSADVGVSLHSSSSALDLPMKVVDMFGCGLPVCALDFACLSELVIDGKNGLIFKDATQLAGQLETLLMSFPHSPALETLRATFERGSSRSSHSDISRSVPKPAANGDPYEEWSSWDENWRRVVRPLVLTDVRGDSYLSG